MNFYVQTVKQLYEYNLYIREKLKDKKREFPLPGFKIAGSSSWLNFEERKLKGKKKNPVVF